MDIDALSASLGVDPNSFPDAAAAAPAAPSAQLAPLGAFDAQPAAPPPTAGGSSSLPAAHGLAAPAAPSASGSAAPASGGGVSFKNLVVGLMNDPSLSDAVKEQISVLGDTYSTNDKATSFSKMKDLVGKERIKQIMLSLTAAGATVPAKRAGPEETQAETQTEKRYLQTIDEVAEEYMCPITFELPIDPVIAEDDRCYERCAIEEWFER